MEFLHPLADKYAMEHCSTYDPVLYGIYQDTMDTHAQWHMQSSWVQGSFLTFISNIVRPQYVLEIGTFTGFSALCLAQGLALGGELHTIELREEDAQKALQNFSKTSLENKIILHVADARQLIPSMPYRWDLVFIDADKISYIDYYELVVPRMNSNGIIIADNVLFHGEVLEGNIKGKNAKAIDAFNKHVAADERTEQIILTVRDGLMLIKNKQA